MLFIWNTKTEYEPSEADEQLSILSGTFHHLNYDVIHFHVTCIMQKKKDTVQYVRSANII